MVGRVVNPDYRRDLNFLSRRDYTRCRARYTVTRQDNSGYPERHTKL